MDDLVPKGHPEDDMFYREDLIWHLTLDIGIWKLFGIWDLGFGTWNFNRLECKNGPA